MAKVRLLTSVIVENKMLQRGSVVDEEMIPKKLRGKVCSYDDLDGRRGLVMVLDELTS
jgi:hypothetical protein